MDFDGLVFGYLVIGLTERERVFVCVCVYCQTVLLEVVGDDSAALLYLIESLPDKPTASFWERLFTYSTICHMLHLT